MKKSLVASVILFLPILAFSQYSEITTTTGGSVVSLNQGIYLSMDEFLANEPSISCDFEVHSSVQDYYGDPEERSDFVVSFRDNMGYVKVLSAREIWGYCDGGSIYISYLGKPYEVVYLGAISLIRFHPPQPRSSLTQLLSLYLMGRSVSSPDRSQEALFHMNTGTMFVPTSRNIKKLISADPELYTDYEKIRNMDYFEKNLIYLQKYNEKYPLIISETGITVSAPPAGDVLVQKQPI
jgi:hypothetical protein